MATRSPKGDMGTARSGGWAASANGHAPVNGRDPADGHAPAGDSSPLAEHLAATAGSGTDEPTAGLVLHRVLARSARAFLLNDVGPDGALPDDVVSVGDGAGAPGGIRRPTETERIHQSRVAMRRIRSNLRTFRLLVEPGWGTAMRAELAWYTDRLGASRDLHVLRDTLTVNGPVVADVADVARILALLDDAIAAAESDLAASRDSERRARLVEQMRLLHGSPPLVGRAGDPAGDVLAPMLHRTWHDVRGAAHEARRHPTPANLHKLRIRLKGLRYGCETVALVEGGPAKKTARAAEQLQGKLGDLHDAYVSVDWLVGLAGERPELAETAERMVAVQRAQAAVTRKGWKRDLKDVERRWRRWQG